MPGFDTWHAPLDGDVEGFAKAFGEDTYPGWLPEDLRGYNVVRLSQSFVESYRKCPSSAVAEKRATYGVAAAAGIVAHAVVEGRIREQMIDHEIDSTSLHRQLEELAAEGWRPHDMAEFLADAQAKAELATRVYLDKYLDRLVDVETELSGSLLFDLRDDPRTPVDFILVTGTADVVGTDRTTGKRVGVDWKTGSSMTEPWITQRYGVQWRAYAAMFGLDEFYVEYVYALHKGHWVAKRYNGVTVCVSSSAEREAFERQLLLEFTPIATALFWSVNPADHPIHPTDWHCGKWCNVFLNGQCLGADTEVTWIAKEHEKAANGDGGVTMVPLPERKK